MFCLGVSNSLPEAEISEELNQHQPNLGSISLFASVSEGSNTLNLIFSLIRLKGVLPIYISDPTSEC